MTILLLATADPLHFLKPLTMFSDVCAIRLLLLRDIDSTLCLPARKKMFYTYAHAQLNFTANSNRVFLL